MLHAINTFSVQNSNNWDEDLDMLIMKKKPERRNYSKYDLLTQLIQKLASSHQV